MKSLIEPQVIRALYEASQAGVKIDLIVRGICALRPGIKGVSTNIRVRSIIGRFLEHTRIFYFENGGDTRIYLSSADWMGRNFFNRVETSFPIEDPDAKNHVFKEGLQLYLSDNSEAWILKSDGTYEAPKSPAKASVAQDNLLELLAS
jgi:polyphosphate kinase